MQGQLLIDGQWTEAGDGQRFDVLAPATESVLGLSLIHI